ncbi:MAG: serine/threonine protein kinase [Candidatus Dadabacteria bacterium]|nr:MAG: serine/threonine protein kinase [Candidatus Dadabacteria bacterium]
MAGNHNLIEEFNFPEGLILAGKYVVRSKLGEGWEGEVYIVEEKWTGIERAAKFFYPHRNPNNKNVKFYAKKLHKLRECPIVIQYHTLDSITFKHQEVPFLVSEYVEGELLSEFLKRQRGGRVPVFQGLHLLHALASGIEKIHNLREYHGDLHAENIIVRRYGLSFELKLLDMFHWQTPRKENIEDDVCDLVRLFYEAIGGSKHYHAHPPEVKSICCGLKRSLILKKFRTAGQLRRYIETLEWH